MLRSRRTNQGAISKSGDSTTDQPATPSPGEFPGVIGEEYAGPHPCSGWRRRLPLPDYFRFDGRLGRTHTSLTSDVQRGSSRSRRGAPTFRGEALQGSRRPWLRINVRGPSIPGQQNFVYRWSPATPAPDEFPKPHILGAAQSG